MPTPDIALAASARDWPDRLHRFLLDHGGGRITRTVMSHEQSVAGGFEVLLIDDVCSFLTPRLVTELKAAGIDVMGVYVPEDGPDAKRRLLECGIVDVIETGASPDEFLAEIESLVQHREPVGLDEASPRRGLRVGLTSAVAGVGVTEMSIAIAFALSESRPTVLIDADQDWPSIAQRLGMPVHPNIRTAFDHVLHTPEHVLEAMITVDDLLVVGGRADDRRSPAMDRAELGTLLDGVSAVGEVIVVDLGVIGGPGSTLLRELDTAILVSTADPVGVARLIKTATSILEAQESLSLLLALNRVTDKGFRAREATAELSRAMPDVPVTVIPEDSRVGKAAWDGLAVPRGSFAKAVRSIAGVVIEALE